jgi:hypothetical protein
MVNPIGTSHRHGPLNGDGPPKQTGLVTNGNISSAAAAERESIVESRLNTTAIRTPDALAANFFGADFASVSVMVPWIKMRISRITTLGHASSSQMKSEPSGNVALVVSLLNHRDAISANVTCRTDLQTFAELN